MATFANPPPENMTRLLKIGDRVTFKEYVTKQTGQPGGVVTKDQHPKGLSVFVDCPDGCNYKVRRGYVIPVEPTS